ncbi:MAG: alpha/beta hydrolase [Methanoregulaceae archaeon]
MTKNPVKTVRVGDVAIAYQDSGSGYPLILINGFASTMDTWNPPVLTALRERFRVLVFDNRGTGYSSPSDKEFSIPLFAEDTALLMDALGIGKANILGFSMGAAIALDLAISRPERVDKLVLVSGSGGGAEVQAAKPEIWAKLMDRRGTPSEIADRMFSLIFPPEWLREHPDPWAYCPAIRETTSEEIAARQIAAFTGWRGGSGRLGTISSATLLITGTDDAIIPPANSLMIASRIPGARVIEFEGAGHGLMYQVPDRFCEAVLDFLG